VRFSDRHSPQRVNPAGIDHGRLQIWPHLVSGSAQNPAPNLLPPV